jgi:hypothetical protein
MAKLIEARAASRKALGHMMAAYDKMTLAEIATLEAELAVDLDDMRLKELFTLMDELESRNANSK